MLALDTSVPSSSTGSKIATGVRTPVLPILHSISNNVLIASSSLNLNAIALLKNLAVRVVSNFSSLNRQTIPSIGKPFSAYCAALVLSRLFV